MKLTVFGTDGFVFDTIIVALLPCVYVTIPFYILGRPLRWNRFLTQSYQNIFHTEEKTIGTKIFHKVMCFFLPDNGRIFQD